jgi:hypothetical protein
MGFFVLKFKKDINTSLPLLVADEGRRGGVIACHKGGVTNPVFSA